jgi:hypothetical protein
MAGVPPANGAGGARPNGALRPQRLGLRPRNGARRCAARSRRRWRRWLGFRPRRRLGHGPRKWLAAARRAGQARGGRWSSDAGLRTGRGSPGGSVRPARCQPPGRPHAPRHQRADTRSPPARPKAEPLATPKGEPLARPKAEPDCDPEGEPACEAEGRARLRPRRGAVCEAEGRARLRPRRGAACEAEGRARLPVPRTGHCEAQPSHLGGPSPPHLRGRRTRHLPAGGRPFVASSHATFHSSPSFANVPTNSLENPSSSPPK